MFVVVFVLVVVGSGGDDIPVLAVVVVVFLKQGVYVGGFRVNRLCGYIYMATYICCEVIIWSKFGLLNSYYLVQVRVIIWSMVILGLHLQWFQAICEDSIIILCFCCAQLSGNFPKMAFFGGGAKFSFSNFCVVS